MSVEHGGWIAASGKVLQRLLHDLKQPLNLIRVVAQDVRLDVERARLDLAQLPASMAEIERTVDGLVHQLNRLRPLYHAQAAAAPETTDGVWQACEAAAARGRAEHPGCALVTSVEPDLPEVSLGPTELEPLVFGLLDAGLRSCSGADALELSARRDGAWVVIAVAHRGEIPSFPIRPGSASMGAVVLLPLREPLETQ